jgi:hypothetical protein
VRSHELPRYPVSYTCIFLFVTRVDSTMRCLLLFLLWAGGATRPLSIEHPAQRGATGRVAHATSYSLERSCHASAQRYAGQASERMRMRRLGCAVAFQGCTANKRVATLTARAACIGCKMHSSPHSITRCCQLLFLSDLAHSRGTDHTPGRLQYQTSMDVFRQGRCTPIVQAETPYALCFLQPFFFLFAVPGNRQNDMLPLSSSWTQWPWQVCRRCAIHEIRLQYCPQPS